MTNNTISFKCAKCGSDKFRIPENPKPDDMITCANGHSVRYGDAQKQAVSKTEETIKQKLSKIFGKSFKPK